MKRTLKRIKVAWQIIIGKRKFIAITYNGKGSESVMNLNHLELSMMATALNEAADDIICDNAVTHVNRIVCLN